MSALIQKRMLDLADERNQARDRVIELEAALRDIIKLLGDTGEGGDGAAWVDAIELATAAIGPTEDELRDAADSIAPKGRS
jgi:hypothetical protein